MLILSLFVALGTIRLYPLDHIPIKTKSQYYLIVSVQKIPELPAGERVFPEVADDVFGLFLRPDNLQLKIRCLALFKPMPGAQAIAIKQNPATREGSMFCDWVCWQFGNMKVYYNLCVDPNADKCMADVHNPKTRSYNMSRIKSKDTKPEMVVRRFLFGEGLGILK
jgi:hypothetical protein